MLDQIGYRDQKPLEAMSLGIFNHGVALAVSHAGSIIEYR